MQREEESIPGMGQNVLGGWSRVSLGKNDRSWRRPESQTQVFEGPFSLGKSMGFVLNTVRSHWKVFNKDMIGSRLFFKKDFKTELDGLCPVLKNVERY